MAGTWHAMVHSGFSRVEGRQCWQRSAQTSPTAAVSLLTGCHPEPPTAARGTPQPHRAIPTTSQSCSHNLTELFPQPHRAVPTTSQRYPHSLHTTSHVYTIFHSSIDFYIRSHITHKTMSVLLLTMIQFNL